MYVCVFVSILLLLSSIYLVVCNKVIKHEPVGPACLSSWLFS